MKIVVVETHSHKKQFRDLVSVIYQNDCNYIRPLDVIVEASFNPASNPLLEKGRAIRYLLYDDNNEAIGRIAAFVNPKKAYIYKQPTGGIGFFECIDNKDAAFLLFDQAKQWLFDQGMEAMDGPINFGENDSFWGLLIDGFTPPAFGMSYNPPYYKSFFEAYGFNLYYEQITNHLDLKKPFPERFWRIAERLVQRPEFTFRHFSYADVNKFVSDAIDIYNDAWQFHESFSPLDRSELLSSLNKSKSFLQEDLIWFAYFNNQPIAFLVMFPDVNQIFKHFNGKLGLFQKICFWWLKRRKTITRTRVTVLGVKTHYQRMGVESGLFYHLRDVVKRNPHITEMELSWVGDFNPKMRALQDAMESVFGKKHITYRYLFDADKNHQFLRLSAIPVDTKYRSEHGQKDNLQ